MECIKVLFELNLLSTQMDVDFLKHFFKTFDPEKSVSLNVSLQNIHVKKMDSADFRSAYYQFCDWFYGWSVSDTNEFLSEMNTSLNDDDFQMKRVPRSIDIHKESELQECERMMQNYITLLRISLRSLKRTHIKIDELMPLIGTSITTSEMFNLENKEEIVNKDLEELWANHVDVIEKMDIEKEGNNDINMDHYLRHFKAKGITVKGAPAKDNNNNKHKTKEDHNNNNKHKTKEDHNNNNKHKTKDDHNNNNKHKPKEDHNYNKNHNENEDSSKHKINKNKSKVDTKNPLAQQSSHISKLESSASVLSNSASVSSSKNENHAPISKRNSKSSFSKPLPPKGKDISIFKKKDVLGSNMTFIKSTEELNDAITEEGNIMDDPFEESEKEDKNLIKAEMLPKTIKPFEPETEVIKNELTKESLKLIKEQEDKKKISNMENIEQIDPEILNNLSTSLSKLTDFEKASIRRKSKNLQLELPKINQSLSPQKNESVRRVIEEDIDYVLIQIDHSMDYTLMCISNLLVVLSFASILNQKDILQKYIVQANEIAKDFIANTLKNLWDILHLEIPMQRLSLVGLRDMTKLSEYLKELLHNHNAHNTEKTRAQSTFKVQKMHHKLQLFHYICTCLDIQILPTFMDAHSGGVKSMEASSFDKNLWLTAGYDGTIKIYNMKKKKLLSQYAGHRSIVTSAHFTREDSNIISCSFDQTIKIWNAKTAKCEKTLTGHSDSIITCAVTPNSRYIISGGVDCSIRLWELATGNNILTIYKHTRWVKIIKVSLDGRYMVSGGLDKKIYVWDIKFLVNSKNPTPSFHRCIDYHTDYILDIDLGPNDTMISSSSDMTVKVQNYVTGALLHNISLTPIWATAIKFTEDGSLFGLGCSDNSLLIYSTATGKFLRQIRLFNFGIISIAFDRELEYALIGTSEGIIQKVTL